MSLPHQTDTFKSERVTGAHLPKDDHRQSHFFEQRIAAMEQRIKESGLPNQSFPFIAAKCVATPEWNILKEAPNFYDGVCVLKGLRPVALLSARDLQQDPLFRDHLLRSIQRKGLVVCEDPQMPDYIAGEQGRVTEVLRIIKQRMTTGDYSEQYHRELGQALAYPQVSIERFIRSIAIGENALEALLIEKAFPVGDESALTVSLPSGRTVAVR